MRNSILALSELVNDAIVSINQATDIAALNSIRIEYLGKKGHLTLQIPALRKLSEKERPEVGELLNEAKKKVWQALKARKTELENAIFSKSFTQKGIDVSLPGRRIGSGGLHPVTRTIDRIETFYTELGFSIVTGPEIEDDYHNFDALNIPPHHPARADHDTFWFDSGYLLRTQTSGVQIRVMQEQTPPIRIIASGRVYRHDYDQIHTPMFHQVEGLIIDRNVNFSNLKGTMHDFLGNFFEKDLQIRFRPSYFPFTKPSAEVDVMDINGKWVEVLGCGTVHPNVLRNVGIDSEIYSGFAFGMGVERLTMLRYGISDLRAFFENDLRFLIQFK